VVTRASETEATTSRPPHAPSTCISRCSGPHVSHLDSPPSDRARFSEYPFVIQAERSMLHLASTVQERLFTSKAGVVFGIGSTSSPQPHHATKSSTYSTHGGVAEDSAPTR
jgi:hypothetical protein